MLFSMRYLIPAAVCVAGLVIVAIAGPSNYGPDALAALFGAGGAIYLMNKFMRMGIEGDNDRDVEEARRMFLDRYGRWPDEVPAGWTSPDRHETVEEIMSAYVEVRRHSKVAA